MKKNKGNKFTAIMLCLVLVLSTGMQVFADDDIDGEELPENSRAGGFSDIDDHWAKADIKRAAEIGIVGGYPDGTFLPDNYIKREEFFSLLVNILTETPQTDNISLSFTDVDYDEWYIPVIKGAVASGLTSGYPDGTVGIGKVMTREEGAAGCAAVISAETDGTGGVEEVRDFNSISDWAVKSADLMYKKGYMQGDTENNFRPLDPMTRAEATRILLQIHDNEGYIGPSADEAMANLNWQELKAELSHSCAMEHLNINSIDELTEDMLQSLPGGYLTGGDGTASAPYEISTQDQLNHMREHNHANTYFRLVSDITITKDYAETAPRIGEEIADWRSGNWIPVGTKEEPFLGHFDGGGYTISGLVVDSTGDGQEKAAPTSALSSDASGLFGWVDGEASISNVGLADSKITNNGSYTGAIAGYVAGSITGCVTEGTVKVSGRDQTGGIVGYASGVVKSCVNSGDIQGSGRYTGGIAGYYVPKGLGLSGCENNGKVNGTDTAGGIIGIIVSDKDTPKDSVYNLVNNGAVESGPYNTGGIIGLVDASSRSITISDCINNGSITTKGVGGGILGYAKTNQVTVTKCENYGDLDIHSGGGIVGNNEGTVSASSNTGNINGSIYIGGIVGQQNSDKSRITKTYNEGDIYAETGSSAGGIVGQSSGRIEHSYNAGSVEGQSSIGGVAGKNLSRMNACYNAGDIKGSNETGSLTGRNSGTIGTSFWLEGTAEVNVGGSLSGKTELVYMVTDDQLRGRETVRYESKYYKIIEILNGYSGSDAAVWEFGSGEYAYPVLIGE